jgi:hypothetical protein
MPSGHSRVMGALPSSTSSSSSGKGDAVTLSPLPDLSSPGASTVSDELTPVFAPMKLVFESVGPLKFLLLGLMGYTQAFAGPFVEGEQLL